MSKKSNLNMDKISKLYEQGISTEDLAIANGVSKATIQRRLRALGVIRSSNRKKLLDIDKVKTLYLDENLSISEVAKRLGVCYNTVQSFISDNKITKSKAKIRETYNNTMNERYGIDVPILSPNIKSKIKDTKSKHSENKQPQQVAVGAGYFDMILDYDFLYETFINQNMRRSEIAEMVGCSDATVKKALRKHKIKKERSQTQKLIEGTCFNRYGTKSNMATEEFKSQSKATCLEKYGHEHPQQSPSVREKSKKTNLEKYGYDNPSKSPEIIEKIRKANSSPECLSTSQAKRAKTLREK